ncbi:helicase associated domain-containing protein [Streptomyces smyrnaeus]|uniref:helicase associated domain-containing protein n=1 Tax=Streptomyces smyrnaeus TaxID=1387713 RepID=UPI0033E3830C
MAGRAARRLAHPPAQQQRLTEIGVRPAPTAVSPAGPAVPAGATRWELNLAAARQYKAREGHLRVPRAHTEVVTDTSGREHHIRLGVFRSNTRSHHKQHKLTPGQSREAHDIGLLA